MSSISLSTTYMMGYPLTCTTPSGVLTVHVHTPHLSSQWTMEEKKNEKEKKKVKGGRVQVGKRMPAGRKAVVTHQSSSDSSHEEEGEDGTRESQVRPDVLCP